MTRLVCLAFLFVSTLALVGCGTKYIEVHGVVKLDGTPVENATVTFVSDKGDQTFSGSTDSDGQFSLTSGPKPGAPAGAYKVLIVKSPRRPGAEAVDPTGTDYMKQMKKEAAESAKAGGGGSSSDLRTKMMMGKGGGGPPPPPNPNAGVKSELPTVYAKWDSTPLTAKVPPDAQPLVIELKSKP